MWTKGGKKHGNVRYVCRLLSQCLEKLTEEERQIIGEWCNESDVIIMCYSWKIWNGSSISLTNEYP